MNIKICLKQTLDGVGLKNLCFIQSKILACYGPVARCMVCEWDRNLTETNFCAAYPLLP